MSCMSAVCRICLRDIVDLQYSIEDSQLRREYEKLVGTMLNAEDALPKTICSICYGELKKIQNFCKMALESQSILKKLKKIENISTLNIILTQRLSATPIQCLCINNNTNHCPDLHQFRSSNQYVDSYVCTNNTLDIKKELTIKTERLDDTKIPVEAYNLDTKVKIKQSISRDISCSSCFKCDICSQEFGTKPLLRSHMISHSNNKPFSCKKCNKTFSRNHNMVQHRKKCLSRKRKIDNTNSYIVCIVCCKTFSSKSNLKSHLITHSGVKPYACTGCKKSFARKQDMERHMQICSKIESVSQIYSCKYCIRTFYCRTDLKKHWVSDTADKPFICCKCNKTYATQPILKVHMKICFLKNEEVHCNLCTKVLSSRTELCKHLNSAHNEDKPYICDQCSKKFWYKSALKTHMRSHTGEKPYACEICGKFFRATTHLKTHMGTHTQHRPFSCEICGKAFRGKFNLREHLRCHTGERPFTCKICGKAFAHQSTLRLHRIKVHTEGKPYACSNCSMSYSQESSLIAHMRVHTAERPYACKQCNKTFTQARHLKGHMQVHSDHRPYVCACGNAYKRMEHLKQHAKSKCKANFANLLDVSV